MVKLDLKDRKILYNLDLNCRQSNAQIGKKVGLSKEVVNYRIKRMEEEGVINGYYTCIDSYKLGYYFYRFYINFQYVSSDLKKEIINHFVEYKNISTISSAKTTYDLIVVLWVDNINEFYDFWEKTLVKYGDYFAEQKFSLYIKGYGYPTSILLEENEILNRKEIETFGITKKYTIDKTDYDLLNLLALNARKLTIELAKHIKSSSQTVTYRMNTLVKKGIIQSFRVIINNEKIGFVRIKADIYLKEHGKRYELIKYIKSLPNLRYFSSSIGLCDLELEFLVKDIDELTNILEKIDRKHPGSMKKYHFYSGLTPYIETFIPKMKFK
jgi:Lrp/AsnC family leucine-responsive transcriptional regulator